MIIIIGLRGQRRPILVSWLLHKLEELGEGGGRIRAGREVKTNSPSDPNALDLDVLGMDERSTVETVHTCGDLFVKVLGLPNFFVEPVVFGCPHRQSVRNGFLVPFVLEEFVPKPAPPLQYMEVEGELHGGTLPRTFPILGVRVDLCDALKVRVSLVQRLGCAREVAFKKESTDLSILS